MSKLPVNLKSVAIASLTLPLVMWLLRMLWPDISWGFLLLFGLQVMLMLATLQLVVSSVWTPTRRLELPGKNAALPRRIFAKKTSVMAFLRGMVQRARAAVAMVFGRLFKRKAT
jgi:hypothetical protein